MQTSVESKNSEDILLELKELYKIYIMGSVEVQALRGIDLTIDKGEFISIMGTSGSGKSTLMNIIGCLDRPTKGNYFLEGIDIKEKSEDELSFIRNQKIGFVFQSFNLIARTSAVKNVELPMIYAKMHANDRHERAKQLLEKVGLGDRIHHMPNELSGGQRQRIGIARALIMNPDLIIADEAISALDVSIQAQVVNLMKKIQKETGIAYLFIAHDLSMVKYISDKIGVLHLGHLVETGTTEEIFDNPIHPYTKSLLSAIPHPNPRVEKVRKSFTYDYKESGVDYTKGTEHLVDGTHYVLATDEEFEKWTKK